MMANDDDFTFSPVVAAEGQDAIGAKRIAQGIGGIKIDDKSLNGVDSSHSNGILWKDKLPNNAVQRKKGSLSFTVIDASAQKQVNPHLRQDTENVGSSVKASLALNSPAKQSAPRKKVPFEKGYSQMDWMRLTRTHPDVAGLNGQSSKRLITMNEVKQHLTEGSMWTVLKGRVYNIAPYMKFHPGGVDMLMKAVGKDCTSLFNKYHAWVNADILLEKCLVGTLDDSK